MGENALRWAQKGQLQVKKPGSSQAQPLASSTVSARSEVVLGPLLRSLLRSLRINLASMLIPAVPAVREEIWG